MADAINKLKTAMPVINQRAQQQAQAARSIQLQQALQQAQAQGRTQAAPQQAAVAQQLGAAATQATGQQALAQQARVQQQAATLSQSQLAQQREAARTEAGQKQLALGTLQFRNYEELTEQERQLEDEIFQKRLMLRKDRQGQIEYQENQLMDLAVVTAKDNVDMQRKMQYVDQASKTHLAYMEALNSHINLALESEQRKGEAEKDHELVKELTAARKEMERSIREAERRRQQKSMIASGLLGAAGAAAGAYFGGPGGAAAGGQAGAAAGSALANA